VKLNGVERNLTAIKHLYSKMLDKVESDYPRPYYFVVKNYTGNPHILLLRNNYLLADTDRVILRMHESDWLDHRCLFLNTMEFFCRRHYRTIGCPRKFDVYNKY